MWCKVTTPLPALESSRCSIHGRSSLHTHFAKQNTTCNRFELIWVLQLLYATYAGCKAERIVRKCNYLWKIPLLKELLFLDWVVKKSSTLLKIPRPCCTKSSLQLLGWSSVIMRVLSGDWLLLEDCLLTSRIWPSTIFLHRQEFFSVIKMELKWCWAYSSYAHTPRMWEWETEGVGRRETVCMLF